MSNSLGQLVVEISANSARFASDMGKVAQVAEANAKRMEQAFGLVETSLKAIGVAAVAGLTFDKLREKIIGTIEAAAGLQQLSERTGATVEGLSGLASVAKLSNTDTESLATGLQRLAKSMVEAQNGSEKTVNAFNAIGIRTKDLIGLRPDEAFLKIAKQLATYADGAEKVAVAQILLGKSGANLLPVAKDLADVGALQAKTTGEQAAMADEYEKNSKRLAAAQGAIFKVVGQELIPVFNAFESALLDSLTGSNGLKKSIDDLAKDGTIREWAQEAALKVGVVIETFQTLGLAAVAVGGSFKSVFADIELAATVAKAIGPTGGGILTNFDDIAKALEKRNKTAEDANRAYEAAWNKDTQALTRNMRERFELFNKAAENYSNEGRNIPRPRIRNLGSDDQRAASKEGENFVKQLERQVRQMESGKVAMLELEAAQKHVTAAAQPYIDKLKAAEAQARRIESIVAAVADAQKQQGQYDEALRGGNELFLSFTQQAEALGLTEEAMRRLTAARQIDQIIQRASINANADTLVQLGELKEKMSKDVLGAIEALEARQKALNSDWSYGATEALRKYSEQATKTADQVESVLTNAFKSMEDALVSFAQTGKLNFRSLANSIIADLIRIQVQKSLSGLFGSSTIQGFLGTLGSIASGSYDANYSHEGLHAHKSGLAYVPYDGYPAILHEGERVMTKSENTQGSRGMGMIDASTHIGSVGAGVSRGEMMAALRQSQAESEARWRRLTRNGNV